MNNKFYTCRCDVAFKEVFMKEKNKDLLICLLEKILSIKIEDVKYLNLEKNVDNIHVRRKHFDLSLKTDKGYIQVEMNSVDEDYVRPRNTAYICNTYSHHTLRGESYNEDIDIIQINLSYGLKYDEYFRKYYIQDNKENKFVKNFIIYEINMDKYMKFWYTKDHKEIQKNKELIMLDLRPNDLENLAKDGMVKKYMEELERVNEDPDFIEFMSAEEDNRKIENSRISSAIRKGQAIGQKIGLEQGHASGLEEGRADRTIEIARNFLKLGTSIKDISKATGLSIEEINNLKE